ncbi:MAG: hypothetical protein KIT09_05440 [Bryobacteraceae bacterium]|nr:hypothetical protein [Bryobacteraceae bacterium]
MTPRSSLVVNSALAAVALLSLYSLLDLYQATKFYNQQQPDPYRIGYQAPRFAEAMKMLPPDAVVGYVSNLDFGEIRGSSAFFGAQFALAPRIVVPNDHPASGPLVLGNFSADVETSDISSRLAREQGLRVVRDFDAGVVLFRKEGAK